MPLETSLGGMPPATARRVVIIKRPEISDKTRQFPLANDFVGQED